MYEIKSWLIIKKKKFLLLPRYRDNHMDANTTTQPSKTKICNNNDQRNTQVLEHCYKGYAASNIHDCANIFARYNLSLWLISYSLKPLSLHTYWWHWWYGVGNQDNWIYECNAVFNTWNNNTVLFSNWNLWCEHLRFNPQHGFSPMCKDRHVHNVIYEHFFLRGVIYLHFHFFGLK